MSRPHRGWSVVGPTYTEASICDLLGIDPGTLEQLVDSDQVLRVTGPDGTHLYPVFQIGDDRTLLPGLPEVIAELASGSDDPWTWWRWLLTRFLTAQGRQPAWQIMRDGDVEDVIKHACRAAWVWRL